MKIFGIVRSAAQLITDAFTAGDLRQPNLTLRGNIATESILITPTGSAPSVADVDDDVIDPAQTVALGITENYVFNTAAGAWNRVLSIPDNADGQAALTQGTPGVIARLQGWNGATFDRIGSQGDNADSVAAESLGHLKAVGHNSLFNNTTWDRQRGNTEGTALASAVRNATTASVDFTNYNGSEGVFFLNITAVPGVQTITMQVQGKDPLSSNYITIVSGAAQVATGISAIVLSPFNGVLPRTFRINIVHSGAGNFTYSVGYSLNVS